MTPQRRKALARGEGCIQLAEWREGWHFCQDFDLDLTDEKDENGRCPWCGFSGDLMPYPEEERSAASRLIGPGDVE